jgi:hypothetical protein
MFFDQRLNENASHFARAQHGNAALGKVGLHKVLLEA